MTETADKARQKRRSKRDRGRATEDDPLEVYLSLKVRFGDEPDQIVTVMDDQKLYMAGSVFQYRDKIVRFFTVTLLQVGMTTPTVAGEFLPGIIHLMRKAGRLVTDKD